MTDVVVVGAGPNGLAAAVECALHGLDVHVLEAEDSIGGATRTTERILPGLRHDDGAAIHPTGAASPFFASLVDRGWDLRRYGLELVESPVPLVHPLDDAEPAVLYRSLERTVQHLGTDGASWRRLFGPLVDRADDVVHEVMRPVAHLPRHPVALARFGLRALPPATVLAGALRTPAAKALLMGAAAHAFTSLRLPLSSAVGAMLLTLGHSHGWPVALGGSASISAALVRLLTDLGGAVTTGVRVTDLDQVRELTGVEPRSGRGVVLLDTAPAAAARILAGAQPVHLARRYHRFRHGPGAFRVDLAVRGGVPWRDDIARDATTLHLGGVADEVADAEGRCWRGEMPSRPFVLVAQQHVVDASRSVVVDGHDVHSVWAYAHVPAGYAGDATRLVVDQVERFAPAVRERIVGTWRRTVPELTSFDANLVGGDVCGGANDARQLVARPRVRRPYRTGVRGVYLCSSSTPPGAGVHGMCGRLAALDALADLGVHGVEKEKVR